MDYEYYEHMRNRLRKDDPEEVDYLMHKMMGDMQYRERKNHYERSKNYLITKIIVILIFIALIALSFYLLPSFKGILEAEKEVKQYQAKGIRVIPNLEEKINSLDKKITTLTTKEISGRLHRIEKAIKAGDLNPEDVKTLQELREDFKILKEYMFSDPRKIVEYRDLQKNYIQLKTKTESGMNRNEIIREIDSIQNQIYLIIAIIATIFFSIFGTSLFQKSKPDSRRDNIDNSKLEEQKKTKDKKKS